MSLRASAASPGHAQMAVKAVADADARKERFWEVAKLFWHHFLILWMPGCLLSALWLTMIPAKPDYMRTVVYSVLAVWIPLSASMWYNFGAWPFQWYHWAWLICGDLFYIPCLAVIIALEAMIRRVEANTNRLLNRRQFHGNRICILGNGPSLTKAGPLGELIDSSFDEVVRFNNCLIKGYEHLVGSRCTVHMGDAQLQISWPEHKIEGSTWVLSTVLATMNTAISLLLFRMIYDLEIKATLEVVQNREVGWMSYEEIRSLRDELGFSPRTMPTSGCLAIHWFVRNRPDPSVPVYIHGFDFFQGPQFHYYANEPSWQKVVNRLGLWFGHDPLREKAYVMRLIEEGKVKWLTDLAKEVSVSGRPRKASDRDEAAVAPSAAAMLGEPEPKKVRTS